MIALAFVAGVVAGVVARRIAAAARARLVLDDVVILEAVDRRPGAVTRWLLGGRHG